MQQRIPRCGPCVRGVAKVALGTLTIVLATSGVVGADDGGSLLARAAALTDPRSEESPPSILRAEVELLGIVGKDTTGQYIQKAGSRDMWWEMLRFGRWSEMHGVYEGREWRKRTAANKPVRMYQALHAADPSYHVSPTGIAEVLKVSTGKENGQPVTCVKVRRRDDREATLCFDRSSGVLRSATYVDPKEFYQFEGEVRLGDRVMPRTIRCVSGGEPAVVVTVQDWLEDEDADPASYAPPEGADSWIHCLDPTPPVATKIVTAKTPPGLKARHIFGTVSAYGVIAPDGRVGDLGLVEMRHGVLMDLFRKIVAEWEYQPATCGDTPIPFETVISYSFKP